MFCERCGTEIYDGELYCCNCGAPAPQSVSTSTNNQRANQQQRVYSQPITTDSPKPSYKSLAYTAFYVGLASLVLCWVPVLDIFLLIGATVVTIFALVKVRNKKYSWMPIAAIIYVGISLFINICTIL
jgi:hypothetical protein